MFRRLRDLIQLPVTLSRVLTYVAHLHQQQEETNRRLAELHLGLLQRPSNILPTVPLTPADLETSSPAIPPPPVSKRPRTDADIVVASRDALLESQLRAKAAAIAANREGNPIT